MGMEKPSTSRSIAAWSFSPLESHHAERLLEAILLDLHLLDARQFRTDQPCDGSKPYCAGWDVPGAQVMDSEQEAWLAGELRTRGGAGEAVAVEFVGTLVSAGGDGAEKRHGTDRIGREPVPEIVERPPRLSGLRSDAGRVHHALSHRRSRDSRRDASVTTAATATVRRRQAVLTIA